MHAVFIPYGIKNNIDMFLNDLNYSKLPLKIWKGDEEKYILMQTQIRVLPFGFVEFVFPREYKNQVLTALRFKKGEKYGKRDLNKSIMGIKPLNLIRKVLDLEPIPEFEEKEGFPLLDLQMGLIPIGVRYDKDIVEKSGEWAGWSHEGI